MYKKMRNYSKNDENMLKGHRRGRSLEGLPLVKLGIIEHQINKNINELYKPLNKIRIHESMQIIKKLNKQT